MAIATSVTAGFLLLTIVVQGWLVAIWCRRSRRSIQSSPDRTWQPPATIVLCLRGADPSLPDCLTALANQTYGDYQILCVLDCDDDPAAEVVYNAKAVLADEPDCSIRIIVAGAPNGRCSLKNNSLIAALKSLDDRTEIVAFTDADCIVDQHWLADLVSPLRDPAVGLSIGNRWFVPPDNVGGTLIRWLWHMAASVQMLVFQIPWGGSMAMTRKFAEQAGLREAWSTSVFDDTLLYSIAQRKGKRVAVLPHLLVPNKESVSTLPAIRWIQRQLLNVRLYHPAFKYALLHCLATSISILAALVLLPVGMIVGDYMTVWMMAAGLLAYGVFYGVGFRSMTQIGRRIVESRHGDIPKSSRKILLVVKATVLAQVAYALAMLCASLSRKTRWRGVEYRISGPNKIRLLKYRPMREVVNELPEPNQSIG